jgi:hypothetical protein
VKVSVIIITGPRVAAAPPKDQAVATEMEELLPMCATSRQCLGPTAWLSIREQAITEEKQMELGYEPGTYGNGNKMIVQ